MKHIYLAALVATFVVAPEAAFATPCQACGTAGACSDPAEVCLEGIPEQGSGDGRCTPPCPNPGAPFGGCPTNYTCVPLNDGSNVCVPRSDDCTALTAYTPAAPGQACTTQSCTNSALCIGGTCRIPCTSFGGSGCPAGEFCGFLGLPDNPFFICSPAVGEGEVCGPGQLCRVGLCLTDGPDTLCYRNCGSGAGSSQCGPGQTCDNIPLSGGQSVDLCRPPMSGPPRDGGVSFPDATPTFPDATTSFPDATTSFPDATTNPGEDAQVVNPGEDARVNPGEDARVTGPGEDAAESRADAGGGTPGRIGGGSVVRRSGCSATGGEGTLTLLVVLAPAAAWLRRRRGWAQRSAHAA